MVSHSVACSMDTVNIFLSVNYIMLLFPGEHFFNDCDKWLNLV